MEPPFPGPPGGWTTRAIAFLDAVALFDMLNAIGAVVFAAVWLRWRLVWWLGTVTLTVSMYAAAVFTYATVTGGAWRIATFVPYVLAWVPFLPVIALYGLHLRPGANQQPPY